MWTNGSFSFIEKNKQKIAEANKELKENQKRLEELNKATNNGATATAEQAKEMQQLQDADRNSVV